MKRKVVVLGANGQVGAEVCLRLAGLPDIDLIPISRTRIGSSFLRSRGIPVLHDPMEDLNTVRRILDGASLVANFAFASGPGKLGIAANKAIIERLAQASPKECKHVFTSTLAVNGSFDQQGVPLKSYYGDLKRANEKSFFNTMKNNKLRGWVFRLGHVYGPLQNIYHQFTDLLVEGSLSIPDADRPSNLVFTETIADAIVAIVENRAGPDGLYNLVNVPQWTWRDIVEHHTKALDIPSVKFEQAIYLPGSRISLKGQIFRVIENFGLRPVFERLLQRLPIVNSEKIKTDFAFNRISSEIAILSAKPNNSLEAAFWPAIDEGSMSGLNRTIDLLDSRLYAMVNRLPAWPKDL